MGAPLAPGLSHPVLDAGEIPSSCRRVRVSRADQGCLRRRRPGMKVVRSLDELEMAFESAVRESTAAFGRGECFVERFLERARAPGDPVPGGSAGTVVVLSTGIARCSGAARSSSRRRRRRSSATSRRRPCTPPRRRSCRERLRECRHVRVPARAGRHHLLQRGEHAPSGRAPGDRARDRHRRRARAAPDRCGRAHRLRRPASPGARHRVPHQRRGPRQRVPAVPGRTVTLAAAVRDPGCASTQGTKKARRPG